MAVVAINVGRHSCIVGFHLRKNIQKCPQRFPEKKKGSDLLPNPLFLFGAPGRIRTHDPLVRSQVLYPTELRALKQSIVYCVIRIASGPVGLEESKRLQVISVKFDRTLYQTGGSSSQSKLCSAGYFPEIPI